MLLVASLVGAVLLRLWGGHWPGTSDAAFIYELRLMEAAAAGLAGLALAISGVGLQALLRNPLAEPFILGLSSGAALGVFIQTIVRMEMNLTPAPNHTGAVIGALAIMAIVYLAGRKRGMVDPLGLLLTGVVLATICSAIIMILNYWVGPGMVRQDIGQWMMGYLNQNVQLTHLLAVGIMAAGGLALLLMLGRAMDAVAFSDAEAVSMGVNLTRLRSVLFIVCSVLAAGAVVLAGPIAFVGLICPHLARLMLGPAHRPLVIAAALLGAIMLILANTTSVLIHRAFSTGIMPLGAFTALIAGPMFLWMLRSQLGRGTQ